MGANFLNFRAHELYTINGNKIDETFVKWDEEKVNVLRVLQLVEITQALMKVLL